MKRIWSALLPVTLAACATGGTGTPASSPGTAQGDLPPLIDREVLFGDPQIAGAQVSPDGRWITFRKPYRDVMNIWVKGIDEPFDVARPLTADTTRPVSGYFWSRDGRYVLYVQDKGGNENYHVYAVDPAAAPEAATGVPPARDLTPGENVRAMIIAVPESDPERILVGLNDRDPALHDVYRVDLRTGERELVLQNDANVVGWQADLEGNLRLGVRLTPDAATEILRVENDRVLPTPIYTCGYEETCGPVRFHKDNRRVYMIINKGDADLTRLVLFDPATGSEQLVETDPEGQVDFGGAEFSDVTDELVATYYVGDRLRVYPKDPQFARDYETIRAAVGDGDVYLGSSTADERLHIVNVTSDVDPGATYLYDRETGEVKLLYRPRPDLPTQHLAQMRPVRYTARDGVEIPAYLTLPRGVEPRGLPVVILPHGGPWARDSWGYDPQAQFLANRGYAVLQPNFRGSTGYGKRFLNLGNEQWGTGTMQHDLTDAARWLVDQDIADPERIGIMGGSYGGYATLAGVAFTPELYAAGVSIVGPSSIPTLLASIPPYWGPIRGIFHRRVGNPEDPQALERLREQSPLYSAEQIQAPLLVIQGANDPRVVKAESDQIVIALRDLERDVEYLVAPDEGHGFAGRENRIAMFAAIERFLAEHLDGRYQESMPTEIEQRLRELAVNPDTLTLQPAATDGGTTEMPAFSGAKVKPRTARYQQTAQVGGQTLETRATQTVSAATLEGRPVWLVVDEAQGPMGEAVDSVWIDRSTLLPIRRSARQGPATVTVRFDGGRVTGEIQAGPQQLPIDATVDGPVLGDGSAMQLAISTLPLEPGYATVLRTFDLMQGRATMQRVEVKGVEQVTTPAGTFEAFRVEVTPTSGPGGSTLWIERAAPRRVVKGESKLPAQMGGGTAVTELVR